MDGEDEFEDAAQPQARCPDGCPNAAAPYCPMHEDPSIYRRDENKLHLAEVYAHNAAREMIYLGIDRLREKRGLKEVRVPTRVMDEWTVFTKQVVLDSGEYTAQGEIERKIAQWLDKVRDQDWEKLDRIKERYMRFTPDWRGEGPRQGADDRGGAGGAGGKRKASAAKRPTRARGAPPESGAEYFDDEF